jgi:predicted ArsR family transcriptional regulator
MADPILAMFAWLTPVVARISQRNTHFNPVEQQIIDEFATGWGKTDTADLLSNLTMKYGEKAGVTVEKAISVCIAEDWAKIGASEAHPGTEIADFIRILWVPLQNEGFVYTYETMDQSVIFNVSKCPVYELAKSTGLHKWLYHLACATDLTSTCAFSSAIQFQRTKTLMEGFEYCNHTYTRIENEG